jgi:hypothetical protein
MMLFAAALLALAGVAVAAPAPAPPASAPDPGLRRTLEDFLRQEPQAPPRQLSPDERAELRRQLMEYGRPHPRQPATPETR